MKTFFAFSVIIALPLTFQAQIENGADTTIYSYCSEMPEFPGGNTKLFHHLDQKIVFPESVADSGFTGSYYIKFVIEKDGSVSNVKILKGAGKCSSCDQVVLNAINSLPTFIPGKNNNKPVRVSMTLPIKLCPLR